MLLNCLPVTQLRYSGASAADAATAAGVVAVRRKFGLVESNKADDLDAVVDASSGGGGGDGVATYQTHGELVPIHAYWRYPEMKINTCIAAAVRSVPRFC